jgi:hypothetical protein
MSIDRRLRDAFVAAGREPEGDLDVEAHLRRAVARARPREVGRAVAIVILVASLAGGVFAAGMLVEGARPVQQPLDGGPSHAAVPPAPADRWTALDGVYETEVLLADGQAAGLRHADAFGTSGPMQVWFSRNTVRIEQDLRGLRQIPVSGTIEVTGRRLVVHDGGETVVLDWRRLPNGDLRFMLVADTRTGAERLIDEVLWTSHPWTLVSR